MFVLLFFIFRFIKHHRPLSEKEYIVNSLKLLQEAILNDMDRDEEKKLTHYLEQANSQPEIVRHLQSLAKSVSRAHVGKQSMLGDLYRKFKTYINKIIESALIKKIVIVFFIVQALWVMTTLSFSLFMMFNNRSFQLDLIPNEFIFIAWAEFILAIISLIFVFLGVVTLRYSKLRSYQYFKYSTLIYLLFTQFFLFYRDQLNALLGLFFNIFLLLVINHLINQESKNTKFIKF